jgi:hypothetical protein
VTQQRLVLGALAVQVVVVIAWWVGAPFALRLPLGLLYAFAVPGFAVVGLIRLPDLRDAAVLSVAASIGLGIATAQGLAWAGSYSLGAALAVLGAVSTAGLVAQAWLRGPG